MKPTKHYSQLQETRIAEYLGWDVVSGSGARDMHPGDIISDEWLGECKTHTKRNDAIRFNYNIWQKISAEAMSQLLKPVLFVDNGTQEIENTWVMVSKLFLDLYSLGIKYIVMGKACKGNITFRQTELQELLPYKSAILMTAFGNPSQEVVLVSIETFRDIARGEFY